MNLFARSILYSPLLQRNEFFAQIPSPFKKTEQAGCYLDIPELLARTLEMRLEGLIGKRANSRYETGKRSVAWIKLKLHLNKSSSSAGIRNQKVAGSTLGRCWLDSAKGLEVTAKILVWSRILPYGVLTLITITSGR